MRANNVQSAMANNQHFSFDKVSRKYNDTAVTNERKIENIPPQENPVEKFNFRKIMPISNNQSQSNFKSHSSTFIGDSIKQFQKLNPNPVESSATITVSPNMTPIDSMRGFVPNQRLPHGYRNASNLSTNNLN